MASVGHAGIGPFAQHGEQRRQGIGFQQVVAVEHAQYLALRLQRGGVQGLGFVRGGAREHAQARIAGGRGLQGGGIGVDPDQDALPCHRRLRAQAGQRIGNERGRAAHGDQDRHLRRGHRAESVADLGLSTWRARTPSDSAWVASIPRRCRARCAASKAVRTWRRRLPCDTEVARMR